MIPWRQAVEQILNESLLLAEEDLSIEEACDRYLAEPFRATRDLPPFDNSAMDGYAVRTDQVENGTVLQILGVQPAGSGQSFEVQGNSTVRIMTGGEIPAGADAVIRQEDTEAIDEARVRSKIRPTPGMNVRRKGEDISVGLDLFDAGTLLTAPRIGLAAAQGLRSLRVHAAPRVAILPTGNEISEPGESDDAKAVFNSNAFMLEAAVRRDGGRPLRRPVVSDSRALLRSALASALESDVLITTGGVSVGEFDYVEEELRALGVEILFHNVAIRPGKPLLFGLKRGERSTLVFGLPGNPVSALVTYEVFVRPAIRRMMGDLRPEREQVRAVLEEDVRVVPGVTQFVRAVLREEDSKRYVRPAGGQGSHMFHSLVAANALLILEGKGAVTRGNEVSVVQLD